MTEFKLVTNDEEFRKWVDSLGDKNPWAPEDPTDPTTLRTPGMMYPALVALIGGEFVRFGMNDAHYLMGVFKDMQDDFALTPEEVTYIKERNTIAAIKSVRYRLKLGLREAKDLVDMAARKTNYGLR